jgi:hypothetical protein
VGDGERPIILVIWGDDIEEPRWGRVRRQRIEDTGPLS